MATQGALLLPAHVPRGDAGRCSWREGAANCNTALLLLLPTGGREQNPLGNASRGFQKRTDSR